MRVFIPTMLAWTSTATSFIRGGMSDVDADLDVFREVVSCISPSSNEKTFLCILKKGLSPNNIRDALLKSPTWVDESTLSVDGVSFEAWLYRSTQSHSTSLILLPGMGEHQGLLKELARSLSLSFNVFSMDVVGYGLSEGECPVNMMETAVSSVESLMQHFNLDDESTIIVGHSLGGIVSQNFALRHPSLKGVVNIDGGKFSLENANAEKAAIIRSEGEEVVENKEELLAELMSYGPAVIQELMLLSNEIKTEISGASEAWDAWLDAWYGAGGWESNFALLEPRTLFIKAAKPGSATAWRDILTEYFNIDRKDAVHQVEVVSVVSTHTTIVLSTPSIEEVSQAIARKYL